MNKVNPADMKIISTVIFWALHYDTVTPGMLCLRMNCSEDFAEAALEMLNSIGVVHKEDYGNPDEPWTVVITDITDIPNDMLNILQMNGFTINAITEALKGMPKEKKKVSSNIISDRSHKWSTEDFPSDKLVLIRLQSPDKVFMESRTEIVYLEDLKIAKFVNGVWEIEGPFPLFDFSPLSKFGKLNDDTIVTHWAELNDKEIEAWHHRFDNHFEYNTFKVEIDDDKKEDMYRALILAASCINKELINYPKDDEVGIKLAEAYRYICDIQCCLDRGGDIHALDNK